MLKSTFTKESYTLSEQHKDTRNRLNGEVASFFEYARNHKSTIEENSILKSQNKDALNEHAKDEKPCTYELLENLSVVPNKTKARRLQIKAPAGLGKTHAVISNLHKCKGMIIWFLCPNHRLAEEIKEKIDAECEDVESYVYKGRNKENCKRYQLVKKAGKEGIDIQKNLCKNEDKTCPYFFECPYQEQLIDFKEESITAKEDKTTVIIMAHNYLVAHCSAPPPDLVIVDETHWQIFTQVNSIKIRELERLADPKTEYYNDYIKFLDALKNNLEFTQVFLSKLSEENQKHAKKALEHVEKFLSSKNRTNFKPSSSDESIKVSLESYSNQTIRNAIKLFENICFELDNKKPFVTSLDYNAENDCFEIFTRKQNFINAEIPVLLIDASADYEINKYIWGERLESVEFHAKRNVNITQVKRLTFSKSSLGIGYNGNEHEDKAQRKQLIEFIDNLAEESAKEKILVVASKKVIEFLNDQFPANVITGHFGALRGSNEYEKIKTAIIIGREEPQSRAIESLARCLMSRSKNYIMSNWPDYETKTIKRRLIDDTFEEERVRFLTYPLCNKVLNQIREQEIEQALDRLRLINSSETKKVYLLTSIVIDEEISESKNWNEIIRNTKMDKAIQFALKKAKAFPLSATGILSATPNDLWYTRNAVKSYITRNGGVKWVVNLIKYYIQNDPLLHVKYRTNGARGKPSEALISANEEDPKHALEMVLNIQISHFKIIRTYEP
jgi:hypothetical protein